MDVELSTPILTMGLSLKSLFCIMYGLSRKKDSIETTLNRKKKSTFRSRSESFKTERLYKKCESIKAKTTHAKPQTNDHSEEIIIR